ncbi:MAG TPA: HAD-IA family hydrolase [Acidimicrobiia bacterium]|nr:HAD-IA family hydrolase [Acidimicrobiia bacterium]
MTYRAVIFDLGGVVVPSPFDAFAAYERDHDLPDRFIRDVVAASADHGAWARLERGELTMPQFHDAFAAECAAAGGIVDAAELMGAIGAGLGPRPEMIAAIRTVRARGLRTAALTNNWAPAGDRDDARSTSATGGLDGLFDVVVESSVEGLRKPDPRIYRLTCDRLGVTPPEVVFLDDLGVNLKPARELGMTTIKVVEPADALRELAGHLGFAV